MKNGKKAVEGKKNMKRYAENAEDIKDMKKCRKEGEESIKERPGKTEKSSPGTTQASENSQKDNLIDPGLSNYGESYLVGFCFVLNLLMTMIDR